MKNRTIFKVSNGGHFFLGKISAKGSGCERTYFLTSMSWFVQQKKKVVETWTPQGWNIQCRRNFIDWEIAMLTEIYRHWKDFKGISGRSRQIMVEEDSRGIFKVSSTYKFLIQGNQKLHQFSLKHMWEVKIPLKLHASLGYWQGKVIWFKKNSKRKNICLCSRCYLCGEAKRLRQSVNYL